MTARKPHNVAHVARYTRRSGLSAWAQVVLVYVACDANGAAGRCAASTREIADDIGTSPSQVERALRELRERGIVVSIGATRSRALAIPDERIAPGFPSPVVEDLPSPVTGDASDSRQIPVTGDGAPTYMDQKIQTYRQTSDEETNGGAGEEEEDPAPLLERETRSERRARWGGASAPQKPARTSEPPGRVDPPRTPEGSETPDPAGQPPHSAAPPAGPPGHANVTGARPSTDPLSVVDLAELVRLEMDSDPERLVDRRSTERLLLARARAEGWTLEELRALWLEALGWRLRLVSWSTVFAGGWSSKRAQLLERLRAPTPAPSAIRRPTLEERIAEKNRPEVQAAMIAAMDPHAAAWQAKIAKRAEEERAMLARKAAK